MIRTSIIIKRYSIHDFDESIVQTGVPTNAPAMFDVELSIEYTIKTQFLRINLTVSKDRFHSSTLIKMAWQFQLVIDQLFSLISIIEVL